MKVKTACLVGFLAATAGMLPTFSHGSTTNISTIQISQGNLAIQICGSGCVQVLQQNNIAIVAVNQGGLNFVGSAYLSPRGYDFGKVVHQKMQAFSLANTSGSQPLVVPPGAIGFSGANPGDFAESDNCPIVLWPGRQCTITVTFAPTTTGSRGAVLAVRDSAIDSPNTVELAGTGVAAWVTPASVDFGTIVVGQAAPAAAAVVHNPGSDSLAVTAVGITGTGAGEFRASACGPIGGGGTCSLPLGFTPADGGLRQAVLNVAVAGLGGPYAVPLSGVGAPLALSTSGVDLSVKALDFGSQRVGTTATRAITLRNLGTSPLTVASVAVTDGSAGDFKDGPCASMPFTLAGGASCDAPVSFAPTAPGSRQSSLRVGYGAGGMSFSATAALTGVGLAPATSLTPASLDFGSLIVGQTGHQQLTLANHGTAPANITRISIAGGAARDYAMTSSCGAVPLTLATDASCTLDIAFTPGGLGSRTATVTVLDDAAGSPHTAALAGTGAPLPVSAATGGGGVNSAVLSEVSARTAATPALPNTGEAAVAGRPLTAFISPTAGTVELAWLALLGLLLLIAAGTHVWRRSRYG